jgi:hypothetical protein
VIHRDAVAFATDEYLDERRTEEKARKRIQLRDDGRQLMIKE